MARAGAAMTVTLDRPQRHNALHAVDIDVLHEAITSCEEDPAVRVLVLTGAGSRTFCSGAALSEMESGEMSGGMFDSLTDRLSSLDRPTIARVNGSLYGGGVELALCCDFRIGVTGSRLRVPAAELGVCYPPGGVRRYVARLGVTVASRVLLAAEELEASEMHSTGFLTHLVEPAELDITVDALVERLSALAPLAVRNMKRMIVGMADGQAHLGEWAKMVDECAASSDQREGLRAWHEGRAPDFRGS